MIDNEFGEGYAKENPSLVAAVMKVSAKDFKTTMRSVAVETTPSI